MNNVLLGFGTVWGSQKVSINKRLKLNNTTYIIIVTFLIWIVKSKK